MWKTRLDLSVLEDYRQRRLLRCCHHDSLLLSLWNYSHAVQRSPDLWDDVTCLCRALVVNNQTGEIVARAFSKFWSVDDRSARPLLPEFSSGALDVWEKLDGSLILLFHYAQQWHVTTRGSFTSQQAAHARALLLSADQRRYDVSQLDPAVSYALEAVYPANRVLVDFGSRDELVFLAAFRRDDAGWSEEYESPMQQSALYAAIAAAGLSMPVCYTGQYTTMQQLQAAVIPNCEGFVVRFASGQRVKIKLAEYRRLLRIQQSMISTTALLTQYRKGALLSELADGLPAESREHLQRQWALLDAQYAELRRAVETEMAVVLDGCDVNDVTAGDLARVLKEHPLKAELLALKKGKESMLRSLICRRMVVHETEAE